MTGDQPDERPKVRLPRDRRVAPEHKPPMQLTARDREILKAVNDCRALLGRHIETLFFTSRSTAQYRLARLFQHEYLDRHFITAVTGGPGSSPIVYVLGKRGAAALVAHFGYEPANLRLPGGSAFTWGFLEHLLKINDVRVAITAAAQRQDWLLETWQDEAVFRADPDYVLVEDTKSRTHKKPVLPDGYFKLVVPQGAAHFFLEVDRGTEPHSKFRPQVQVYQAYTVGGGYQARYRARSLRVLVVTTAPRRLENLKAVTRKAGGDRKYWFTTFDQIAPETVLTAPIWQRLDGEALYPLIAPDDG